MERHSGTRDWPPSQQVAGPVTCKSTTGQCTPNTAAMPPPLPPSPSLSLPHLLIADVSLEKLHQFRAEGGAKVKHSHLVAPGQQSLDQVPTQEPTPTDHHTHLALSRDAGEGGGGAKECYLSASLPLHSHLSVSLSFLANLTAPRCHPSPSLLQFAVEIAPPDQLIGAGQVMCGGWG